jgi:hypothetical protein
MKRTARGSSLSFPRETVLAAAARFDMAARYCGPPALGNAGNLQLPCSSGVDARTILVNLISVTIETIEGVKR